MGKLNLSKDLLQEIQDHAHGLQSLAEIAAILEVGLVDLVADEEAMKAFKTGFHIANAEVWKSVQSLAASGSGPAQELALQRLDSIESKMRMYE